MSATKFTGNVFSISRAMENNSFLLDQAAQLVKENIKENIDGSKNARSFKVDDAGGSSGSFHPLSKYTISRRESRGNTSTKPLKDTGAMYRSIGVVRKGVTSRVVGAKGKKNERKLYAQLGTGYTGVVSSDLDRYIPTRNPVGYSQVTSVRVKDIFARAFGMRDNSLAKIDINL